MSMEKLTSRNEELTETIERMKKEYYEMENAHALIVKAQFERIDELNKRNDELFERSSHLVKNRTINKTNEGFSRLPYEVERLKRELKEKDSKQRELILRITDLTARNERMTRDFDDVIQLRSANEMLKGDIKTLQRVKEDQYNYLNSQILKLRDELQNENVRTAKVKQDALEREETLNEKIMALEGELKKDTNIAQEFNRLKKQKVWKSEASAGVVPHVLACGHTFCGNCITQLTNNNTITCPSCKHVTSITMVGLPTNFFAIGIVEEVMKAMRNQKTSREENTINESEHQEVCTNDEVRQGVEEADEAMED